jgi:transcriptional regulator with XRE-family HTH domain
LKVTLNASDYRVRLRRLRAVYGDTQREFAARIGVPFKRWNEYERGRLLLSMETMLILCSKIDGMTADWLLFGLDGNLSHSLRLRLIEAEKAAVARERKDRELKQQLVAELMQKVKGSDLARNKK